MQNPSSQQACPIPCSLVRDTQGLDNNRVILRILLSHKGEVIPQHILLRLVVTNLHTPLNRVMEEHRELVAQGIPPILHKQVEGDTLHILHQGAAILNLSRLEDRTA